MIKKITTIAIVLLLVMAVCMPILPTITANAYSGNVKVTVHYYRFDEQYDKWDLWIWPDGGAGKAVKYNSEDTYGAVASITVEVEEGVDIGVISRKFGAGGDGWSGAIKDVDADRFIANNKIKNGSVEIFLLEGDSTIYYDKYEVNKSARITSASIISDTTVQCKTLGTIESFEKFTLYTKVDDEVVLVSADVVVDDGIVTLNTAEPLDMAEQYYVKGTTMLETTVTLGGEMYTSDFFKNNYVYDGELGAMWDSHQTVFRMWAPMAQGVTLRLYNAGNGGTAYKTIEMNKAEKGTWTHTEEGDLHGKYYTYAVTDAHHLVDPPESVDLYAKSTGVNGDRGMILDMSTTNPEGWAEHSIPTTSVRDAVLYEAHIRDMSIDASSGVKEEWRGKYLGLTQTGTVNSYGQSTVLDHMKELGITHMHLLPSYDYASVDETKLDKAQFNWGYDPENYNTPEGSYSTDPYNGEVRVNEFKQMVQSLHENGINVVMDVVYNHTFSVGDSNFDEQFYGYYYRMNPNGGYYNGSGCGNVTASERDMMRKYMVDSVVHWATEYKVDGFRFDLMGCHDIDTMNAISKALHDINPNIIIYGEGWTGGDTGLAVEKSATKANAYKLEGISVFNDNMRDGIKGSVFDAKEGAYVQGNSGKENDVLIGVIGAVQGSKDALSISGGGYTSNPMQSINYASAHDNNTLWDKLSLTSPNATIDDLTLMNKMSATLVLTSQGTPFFLNGEEMCRTKPATDGHTEGAEGGFSHNSYNSPDHTNAIMWDTKNDYIDMFNYYKGLIAWRKANSDMLFETADQVKAGVEVLAKEDLLIGYQYTNADGVSVIVYTNAGDEDVTVKLPAGTWYIQVNADKAGTQTLGTASGNFTVKAGESYVMSTRSLGLSVGAIIGITAGSVVVAGGGASMIVFRKKIFKAKTPKV